MFICCSSTWTMMRFQFMETCTHTWRKLKFLYPFFHLKTYQMSEILCLLTFCIKVYIQSVINIIKFIICQPNQNVPAASNLAAYNKIHLPAVYFLLKFIDNKGEVSTSSNCTFKLIIIQQCFFQWSNQESRKHWRKCTQTELCFSGLVKRELLGQETAWTQLSENEAL